MSYSQSNDRRHQICRAHLNIFVATQFCRHVFCEDVKTSFILVTRANTLVNIVNYHVYVADCLFMNQLNYIRRPLLIRTIERL